MVVAEVLTVVVLDHLAMTQHQVWGRGIAEQGSGVGGQCGWAVLVGGVDGQCGWAVLVGGVGGRCCGWAVQFMSAMGLTPQLHQLEDEFR